MNLQLLPITRQIGVPANDARDRSNMRNMDAKGQDDCVSTLEELALDPFMPITR